MNGHTEKIEPVTSLDRSEIAIVYGGIATYALLEKAQPLMAGLVRAGYPVTFVTGGEFRDLACDTGAQFEPLDGPNGLVSEEEFAHFLTIPGDDGHKYLANAAMIGHIHEHLNTLQRIFKHLRPKFKKVVYIHDALFLALVPVQLGAPGILPDVSIALGTVNIGLDSDYTYPFPALQPPATTEDARRLHRLAYRNHNSALNQALHDKLKSMDAIEPYPSFNSACGSKDDYLVQLGLPEFEYHRPDMAPKLRFLGIPEQIGGANKLPSWWEEVLEAEATGKPIVVVSQGHYAPNLQDLLLPTLEALRDRNDILVVGTTVTQGADIPNFEVPSNTRLAKFVPFTQLFPKASVLVSTAGFGTVLHAIRAGLPMVLAGVIQDKGHAATIAQHIGIAVNLKTDHPSVDAIRSGVMQILGSDKHTGESSYASNIRRLQKASAKYNTIKRLDSAVLEAVSERL